MAENSATTTPGSSSGHNKGFRFWLIVLSLAVSAFLVALEGTVVSTALPSIVNDLGGSSAYIWVPIAVSLPGQPLETPVC